MRKLLDALAAYEADKKNEQLQAMFLRALSEALAAEGKLKLADILYNETDK